MKNNQPAFQKFEAHRPGLAEPVWASLNGHEFSGARSGGR